MRKVVILVIVCSLFVAGCSLKKTEELTDAERFANEYSISSNNPFCYTTLDDVLELLEKDESFILFLGNSDSEWSSLGARALNRALKSEDVKVVDKVYYFNPNRVKHKQSKKYKQLKESLSFNKNNLPIVFVIQKGEVTDYVDFSVHENSSMDDTSIKQLERQYIDLMSEYL